MIKPPCASCEDIAVVTVAQLRNAKHVIGVEMPLPKPIKFVGNVEFDGATGENLYSTRELGVAELKESLQQAKEDGYPSGWFKRAK